MARRTKDEAAATRHTLLDAAEKIFYRRGVTRTSLDEIAKAAGMTRGAVYWHFKNKLELCEAMLERVFLPQEDMLERLAARQGDTPLDDLCNACCESLRLIATDKRRQRVVSILMFRCEYVEEMAAVMKRRRACKDRMLGRSERLFERAQKLGQLSSHWTPRTAATALHAMMGGLITYGLEQGKKFDLAKAGPACIQTFFRSLGAVG
jgi:TetR/AcrR family acrAB operon transcriptional repressor/TetR/AcrR family transcriptional repressor of mexAB-oprM operon